MVTPFLRLGVGLEPIRELVGGQQAAALRAEAERSAEGRALYERHRSPDSEANARAFAVVWVRRRAERRAPRCQMVLGLMALLGLACSGAPAPPPLAVVRAAPTAEAPAEPMRSDFCTTYEKTGQRWWLTLDGGTSAPSDGGSQ